MQGSWLRVRQKQKQFQKYFASRFVFRFARNRIEKSQTFFTRKHFCTFGIAEWSEQAGYRTI